MRKNIYTTLYDYAILPAAYTAKMKNLRKIILKLGLFIGLIGFLSVFLLSTKQANAAIVPSDLTKGSYTFQDGGNITAVYPSGTVKFIDNNPFDSTRNFKPDSSASLCNSEINITDKDLSAPEVAAEVKLNYLVGAGQCPKENQVVINPKIATNGVANKTLGWNGANIATLAGTKDQRTFEPGLNVDEVDGVPSVYISPDGDGSCQSNGVVKLTSASEGKYYKIKFIAFGGDLPKEIDGVVEQENCTIDHVYSVILKGTPDTNAGGGPSETGAGGGTCSSVAECLKDESRGDSSACVANSSTTMEWLLCPIITAISKFTDEINNFVEGQLHFRVNQLLPATGQVNKAWVIIKNLVSGLVVILMLIMVISQAIGGTFFDAYTVKKMLPRLVIAVIAMQFSWVLGTWLIGLANDLGEGLKQIMLAPFGGGGNMDLPSIMHHLDGTYPAVTTVAILGVLFLLLLTPASTFILPIFLFVGLAIGSAVLIALATLVFRNILIIMAIIFAPLALLLWATPGQTMQSYWKKYADNFAKLLLFFPLVVALIYTGRIAAWLAGGLGTPSLIEYFIVLVAFFGPYFFLPKTFKWGGAILAGINQGINQNKLLNAAKGFGYNRIKAMTAERSGRLAKEWKEPDKYLRSGRREFNTGKWWQKGGRLNPLAFATSKTVKDERGNVIGTTGRRMWQLQGRKMYGLGGGAFFEKGLSNEGMLRRGEEFKKRKDEAGSIREQRRKEFGRDRKDASYADVLLPNGTRRKMIIPKGTGPPSERGALWQKMKGLNSVHERQQEQAAVDLLDDPAFPINAETRLMMDPTGAAGRHLAKLKKQYGLKGDYEEGISDQPGTKDSLLMNQLDLLKARHYRLQELNDKVASGEALKADEQVELNNLQAQGPLNREESGKMRDLQFMYDKDVNGGFRKANEREMTRGERAAVQKNLKLAEQIPGGIEHIDAEMDPDNVLNDLNASLTEGEKIKYTPVTKHPMLQKKLAGTSEQMMKLANIAPQDLPVIIEKFENDLGLKRGEYTEADLWRYYLSDHASYQRLASTPEGVHKGNEQRFLKGKRTNDLGMIANNATGEMGYLLEADELSDKLYKALESGDSSIYSIVTNWRSVDSTRLPIDRGLGEGGLRADDIFGEHKIWTPDGTGAAIKTLEPQNLLALYQATTDEDQRERLKGQIKQSLELRKSMGIKFNDARPISTRDFLIAAEASQMRRYGWTTEQTRAFFDAKVDPKGKPPELLVAPDEDTFTARIAKEFGDEAKPIAQPDVHVETPWESRGGGEAELPRWQMAQQALQSLNPGTAALTRQQQIAVQRAHEVGTNPDGTSQAGKDPTRPAGVGNYTVRQLWEKGKILEAAGFDRNQRRILIERGIVGDSGTITTPVPPDVAAVNAHMADIRRQIAEATDDAVRTQLGAQFAQAQAQLANLGPEVQVAAAQTLAQVDTSAVSGGTLTAEQRAMNPGPDMSKVDPAVTAALAQARGSTPAMPPVQGFAPQLPNILNLNQGLPTRKPVINQTTVVRTVQAPTSSRGVSVRQGPAEGSTRIPHPNYSYDRPGSAEQRYFQAQQEANAFRYAIQKGIEAGLANRPGSNVSTTGINPSGKGGNVSTTGAADKAGRIYESRPGGPTGPPPPPPA
ncbi:TPA: hypothetical protein DIS56_03530 [Candidatus Saccharibacteria bacterium]|nr:hypothetical protein [Candidatus Saccharibacteria bacterium]